MRHWSFSGLILVVALGLAGCQPTAPRLSPAELIQQQIARQIERDARSLAAGEAAVADCIAIKCAVLNIGGMRLTDFSVLNDMGHVTALMASQTNLDDLNDIAGMTQLRELHISGADVADLTGLRHFPNLELLHAEWFDAEVDKSPVGHLTGLRELALGDIGPGQDASFIQNMPKLENLKIRWVAGEVDLEALRSHPSLKKVDVYGALPNNQDAALTLPNLEEFRFNSFEEVLPHIRDELERRGQLVIVVPPMVVC